MKKRVSFGTFALFLTALAQPLPAQQPAAPIGTYHLVSLGDSTAVHHVLPRGGGRTEIGLRDGTLLTVPASAKVLGPVQVGAWVHGWYSTARDGEKVVNWLEVDRMGGFGTR